MGHIQLEKKLYGVKGALDKLDEEFGEFAPKKRTPEDWFFQYGELFYLLKRATHQEFLTRSANYAYPSGYENPRKKIIEDYKRQLIAAKREIDSLEKKHFFFKNGIFVMSSTYKSSPTAYISSGEGSVYYIQSKRKRKIIGANNYQNLKQRVRKGLTNILDKDLIIFLDPPGMSGLGNGPDIKSIEDIYISFLEINIYPRTLEEYNLLSFDQMFPNWRGGGTTHPPELQIDRDFDNL